MSSDEESYCRLCADVTPKSQMISPEEDVAISSKIATKLLWINIDITSTSILPKTICFACFDSLERTWTFLHNVRTAQEKLSIVLSINVTPQNIESLKKTEVLDAGKPIDTNWDTFQELKTEVKVEALDSSDFADAEELMKVDYEIKAERTDEFRDSILDYTNGFDSTDSDLPLGAVIRKKKVKQKKNGQREKHSSNTINVTTINTTWDNFICGCGRCDAQCKNIEALQLHSLQIHNKCCNFKCLECMKTFHTYRSFITHVRTHINFHDLRFCCEFCNNLFNRTSYLKRHRYKEHSTVFLTKCSYCGSCFDTTDQLNEHKIAYSNEFKRCKRGADGDLILKCEFCDKRFKSKGNLQQHRLLHTERSRDFSCHVCGKMFYTKGTLGTHMKTHEEIRPFKCDFCGLAFRTRGNMQCHLTLHTQSKPFVCEQCGKSFRVKRHLKSHSIVHTDLRPFICEHCNKSFRFKTRLNLHLRQHTGVKPYKCIYCQRDFANGSNFKKHLKRRHAVTTTKRKSDNVVSELKTCNKVITADKHE